MGNILIVEDDFLLNKMLTYNLTAEGYQVCATYQENEAIDASRRQSYDLAIVDVNLPDGDGYTLCTQLLTIQPELLVIFLTARDQESEQLHGYEVGGFDYITKPFSMPALLKKIKAMFSVLGRRSLNHDVYDDGRLYIDFSAQIATLNGISVGLSVMEYKILRLFCSHPHQILTRQQLLEQLWDSNGNYVETHTLTTAISRIRSKLECEVSYIRTVYGMGYLWTGGEMD